MLSSPESKGNGRELRALRIEVEAVKRDIAVIAANSVTSAEAMTELRECLKGEEGVNKKVTILWDRQERSMRLVMLFGGASVTALVVAMARFVGTFFPSL